MRWMLVVPLIYLAAVLNHTLAGRLHLGAICPDFLALAAMLWLFCFPGRHGVFVAACCGLLSDLCGEGRLGIDTGCFFLASYLVVWSDNRWQWRLLPARCTAIACGIAAIVLGVGLFRGLLGELDLSLGEIVLRGACVGCYTAGFGLPLLMILGWMETARGQRLG